MPNLRARAEAHPRPPGGLSARSERRPGGRTKHPPASAHRTARGVHSLRCWNSRARYCGSIRALRVTHAMQVAGRALMHEQAADDLDADDGSRSPASVRQLQPFQVDPECGRYAESLSGPIAVWSVISFFPCTTSLPSEPVVQARRQLRLAYAARGDLVGQGFAWRRGASPNTGHHVSYLTLSYHQLHRVTHNERRGHPIIPHVCRSYSPVTIQSVSLIRTVPARALSGQIRGQAPASPRLLRLL